MFYSIARFIIGFYYYFFYRIKVIGQENIPQKGGFILCSNHTNYKDPMILGVVVKRQLSFIGKKELFSNKFFSMILKGIKVIPVDRENVDMKTFKAVISTLKKGEAVGIFAQGKRAKEIEIKNVKSGVALFALRAEVPIIPVCISSSYKHFSKLCVNIGTPILLEEYKGMKVRSAGMGEITEDIMNKITELKTKEK